MNKFGPMHPEDQATLAAKAVVEEQYGEYEPNDDSPHCVFHNKEGDWGPCGGVTYSDDAVPIPLGTYGGKLFDGITVPIPVCAAHFDVLAGRIEKSNYAFN